MGPTNQALVKLFEADQKFRQAQARYDSAARNVRIQERRVAELTANLDAATALFKETQAKAGNTDLDIKTRDAHIEKLREQQQTTKNNKEYQNFLVQISTTKVDKAKIEDEMLKLMELVEKLQQEVAQWTTHLEGEKQKLETLRRQITGKLELIQGEVDTLRPKRDTAAANLPASVREAFERLAERFEGEAVAAIEKPDRRLEEYICGACNMSVAVDLYNRLHSRDETVFCPSCRRFLYIPEELPPEMAINQPKKKPAGKKGDANGSEPRKSSSRA